MSGYILVLPAVAGMAIQMVLTKLWEKRMGAGLRAGLLFFVKHKRSVDHE